MVADTGGRQAGEEWELLADTEVGGGWVGGGWGVGGRWVREQVLEVGK